MINFGIRFRSLAETSNFLNISDAFRDHFISLYGSKKLKAPLRKRNNFREIYSSYKMTNGLSEKEETLPINAIKTVSFSKFKRK